MNQSTVHQESFNQADCDWITANSRPESIAAGRSLLTAGERSAALYWVVSGKFVASIETAAGPQVLTPLEPGSGIGLLALILDRPALTSVSAIVPSEVVAISQERFKAQLKQDRAFAARFYKAAAIQFSQELRNLSGLLVQNQSTASPPLRKVLLVFSELYDSDVNWMHEVGERFSPTRGTVLIQQGIEADAIHILLQGTLSVSIAIDRNGVKTHKEVARLAVGDIVGEMSFIDVQPPSATVTVLENSLVLALPRVQLNTKLEQDAAFATRFYRAIALTLADRLADRLGSFSNQRLAYNQATPLENEAEYEDELDTDQLQSAALASVRFDWLLQQVRRGP
ncbi:MAG: cyclic nucleotide-binding domain-containing protein [Leptolyngbyaceae cyanobacterium bins.59]|nr:cyclic nucleotide-binding domain-containing protein [Leptolyngbyaceae cyanobacterium bins.59]